MSGYIQVQKAFEPCTVGCGQVYNQVQSADLAQ